jgi:hypothetical protein
VWLYFFKKYVMELKIKEEFKKLIPPLTPDEYKQLETNCIEEGIRDAIITWNGYIIDGHNRYKIAQDWQLGYKTISKNFESEYDVVEWMLVNQLGRRNITPEQKDYLIGKKYENEKQRQGRPENNETKMVPLRTAEKIANEVGIGVTQVKRNEQFAKGIDKMNDDLKNVVLQGKSSLNKQDIQIIAKAEPTFIATTEKQIIEKAKELKEQKAQEFKAKIEQRIEQKTQEQPISIDEQILFDKIEQGETVVINMNLHFHVLKYAKDKGIYKQIDRYSEFGNPFFLDSDGTRDQVCDGYIEYFKHKRSLHSKVKDLKGKVLGCHCAPERCHGDHLKQLADENS